MENDSKGKDSTNVRIRITLSRAVSVQAPRGLVK